MSVHVPAGPGAGRLGVALALGVLAATVLLPLPASASSAAERKAEVARKLEEARAAVERIAAEESDVATELEKAETLLREAQATARAATAELTASRKAMQAARKAERATHAAVEARAEQLGPRLVARYRLERQGGAAALLLAESPADWMRLQRAFDTVLAGDLEAIRALREEARAHAEARVALEAAEAEVARRVVDAADAEGQAREAAEARQELLASIRKERRVQEQVVRELGAAQRRLDAELTRLRSAAAVPRTGFGLLRGKLPWPVAGSVVEVPFGKVVNAKFNTVTHQNGLDLRIHEGAEVKAVARGQVAFAGWFRGYGNLVIVDHGDGFHTLYAHLAAVVPKAGDTVQEGDLVGLVGDTGSLKGAYLYFEIRAQGKPLDPMPWFRR